MLCTALWMCTVCVLRSSKRSGEFAQYDNKTECSHLVCTQLTLVAAASCYMSTVYVCRCRGVVSSLSARVRTPSPATSIIQCECNRVHVESFVYCWKYSLLCMYQYVELNTHESIGIKRIFVCCIRNLMAYKIVHFPRDDGGRMRSSQQYTNTCHTQWMPYTQTCTPISFSTCDYLACTAASWSTSTRS